LSGIQLILQPLQVILGIAGIIFPIRVQSSTAWRELPLSIVVTFLFILLANDFFLGSNPQVSRLDGFILLILFGGFLWYVFTQLKKEPFQENLSDEKPAWKIWGLIVTGLAGLVFGGRLVVDNSVELARALGLSENVIGSNIFNLMFILGISSLIRPVTFNHLFNTELIFLLAGTLLLFIAMLTGRRMQLDRWEAAILLILFCSYTVILVTEI